MTGKVLKKMQSDYFVGKKDQDQEKILPLSQVFKITDNSPIVF